MMIEELTNRGSSWVWKDGKDGFDEFLRSLNQADRKEVIENGIISGLSIFSLDVIITEANTWAQAYQTSYWYEAVCQFLVDAIEVSTFAIMRETFGYRVVDHILWIHKRGIYLPCILESKVLSVLKEAHDQSGEKHYMFTIKLYASIANGCNSENASSSLGTTFTPAFAHDWILHSLWFFFDKVKRGADLAKVERYTKRYIVCHQPQGLCSWYSCSTSLHIKQPLGPFSYNGQNIDTSFPIYCTNKNLQLQWTRTNQTHDSSAVDSITKFSNYKIKILSVVFWKNKGIEKLAKYTDSLGKRCSYTYWKSLPSIRTPLCPQMLLRLAKGCTSHPNGFKSPSSRCTITAGSSLSCLTLKSCVLINLFQNGRFGGLVGDEMGGAEHSSFHTLEAIGLAVFHLRLWRKREEI